MTEDFKKKEPLKSHLLWFQTLRQLLIKTTLTITIKIAFVVTVGILNSFHLMKDHKIKTTWIILTWLQMCQIIKWKTLNVKVSIKKNHGTTIVILDTIHKSTFNKNQFTIWYKYKYIYVCTKKQQQKKPNHKSFNWLEKKKKDMEFWSRSKQWKMWDFH